VTAVDIQPSSPARHLVPGAASLHVTDARVHLGGVEILHGVDLQVPTGRTLALLGPSGCGKTTLLRAVAGLQHLSTGRIHVGEDDITDVPAERRNVGMVFQDGALFPHMTVAANVGFGLDRAARRGPAVDEALEMVGLAGFGATGRERGDRDRGDLGHVGRDGFENRDQGRCHGYLSARAARAACSFL